MSLLAQIAIFLTAAVIAIPIFRRFKLGSVLGYLAAGIIIGPGCFGLISRIDTTLHIAEFGIVLLMFVIGLELQPSRLWVLRRSIFGLGTAQVALTTLVLGAVAFLGFDGNVEVLPRHRLRSVDVLDRARITITHGTRSVELSVRTRSVRRLAVPGHRCDAGTRSSAAIGAWQPPGLPHRPVCGSC
jgi:hypothetical protein